eukprot:CAMPEP_0202958740 /NCGR_PEP_ID=MMETSP1396-20130829/3007_1 /ASSEMBLY_ACC=CAM_ASM_000872 /TAXON_ID= /ORGANISM="Pseudokeronopsis sp., Strain Brazil" /LENGTH=69 /DNA_ID=CAMNT_0049676941 /DNA_START=48 /DNA_END=257 /DNA_ORIENTATION=+
MEERRSVETKPEVSATELLVGVALGWSGEVFQEENRSGLFHGPVGFHWPEGNDVDVVHQTVRVRHLSGP